MSSRADGVAHASSSSASSAGYTLPPSYSRSLRDSDVLPPSPSEEGGQLRLSTGNSTTAPTSQRSRMSRASSETPNDEDATVVTGISVQQLSSLIASQLELNNHNIISRFDSLAGQLSLVTDRFVPIENRIDAIEANQPNSHNININSLAAELQDRINRSRNVIIYGVPENSHIPDIDAVKQIFIPFPGVDVASITVTRSRRTADDRPRFITARLVSLQDVLRVLRNRRLLPREVDVTVDRTLEQREHFRALRAEIEQFNAANSGNPKRIKYINGEPTAVFFKEAKQKKNK